MKIKMSAATAFGLESVCRNELNKLDIPVTQIRNGKVDFCADEYSFARAAIGLRTADRIIHNLTDFPAVTFDEVFDNVKSFKWSDLLPKNAKIVVLAKSVKSKLFALSALQSITKKAIIEQMKERHKLSEFPENGNEYRIEISLLNDFAAVSLDMSGALHKRGYRENAGIAPLKETLAAGIVLLSGALDRTVLDPFCGSGTILIEAARIAAGIAPNMDRVFPRESDPEYGGAFRIAREEARENVIRPDIKYLGFDIDKAVLKTARTNAAIAGVADYIHFQQSDMRDISIKQKSGSIITNPPYAVRLGEENEIRLLYNDFGKFYKSLDSWNCSVFTGFADFEKAFRCKSARKRKLYNGGILCNLYIYFW